MSPSSPYGDVDFSQRYIDDDTLQMLATEIRVRLDLTADKLVVGGQLAVRFNPVTIIDIDTLLRDLLKAWPGAEPYMLGSTYKLLVSYTDMRGDANHSVDENHPMARHLPSLLRQATYARPTWDAPARRLLQSLEGETSYAIGTRHVLLCIMVQLGLQASDLVV